MRDIAIFSDIESRIDPGQKDVVTEAFVSAIYEGNPIMVHKSIWNDFATLRKNFYEKSQEKDSIERKYNNLFEKINIYLSAIAEKEEWSKIKLEKSLAKQVNNEKTEIGKLINDLLNIQYDETEIIKKFIYFTAPFDNQSWDAYVLPTFILLIPKQYTENLKTQLKTQMNILLNFGKKKEFNEEEIILGLKTQKLTKMKEFSNKYELPIVQATKTLDTETIKSDLHKIFITKEDLNLSKSSDPTVSFLLPYKWNIFLTGHGGYKKEPELETIQQKLKTLYKKIGNIRSDLTQKKLTEMSSKYPDLLKKDPDGISKIDIMNKIINNETKLLKIITTSAIGGIAGMRIQQFKAFLAFVQNNLDVSFLHYFTCFATGEKTDLIYTTHGIQDIYDFPISASVATDIVASGKSIEYNFILKLLYTHTPTFLIEKSKKRVTIQPKILLQLNKFYQALRDKDIPYDKLVSYVNLDKKNIPAIRFPRTHWLNIAKLDNVMDLSRIRTSIATSKGSITLYSEFPERHVLYRKESKKLKITNYVMLHTPYMPFKININIKIKWMEPSPFIFISLLSSKEGQPTHYIKSIDAPNVNLTYIVNSFSTSLLPKLFLIKNLRCKDDKNKKVTDFKYVIIMNNSNVFSQNKIYNGHIFQHPDEQTAKRIVQEIIPKTPDTPRKILPKKEDNLDSDKLIQKFELYKEQLKQQSSLIETKAIEEAIRKKQASINKYTLTSK